MAMPNCENWDQDLLLLEHGALGGLRRLRVEAHVRRCPRCQERRESLGRVSRLMAGAIRQPDIAAAWRPPAVAASAASPGLGQGRQTAYRPALVGAIALLATLIAVASILRQTGVLTAFNLGHQPPAAIAAQPNAAAYDAAQRDDCHNDSNQSAEAAAKVSPDSGCVPCVPAEAASAGRGITGPSSAAAPPANRPANSARRIRQ